MKDRQDKSETLYFIALVPHKTLRREIREIKEQFRDEFAAGHALKSPAHITLQIPFKRNSSVESTLSVILEKFASGEEPFTVSLNGFGCFAPRVIFIRIMDHEPIKALHGRLKQKLTEELGFSEGEIMKDVQPHITVATRDLAKEAFREAWPEFESMEFTGSFPVNSLFLLKHNGRSWDIYKEFTFGHNG
ncbi:MAG: 2'-5' RNA ligase family protein [Bacteroidales bacterium]|nr:2'-5' RNA ligase family protein [Bacteroidales bacterium]